jgi:hypothetical protein
VVPFKLHHTKILYPRDKELHISPPPSSINCCASHVNGTTLELARSLQRSEGLAALEKVLVLKEIGYAVLSSVPS